MAASDQLTFTWPAPALRGNARQHRPELGRAHPASYAELAAFVRRVRDCGIARLRQLKTLVDAAVREEELLITDEDLPF